MAVADDRRHKLFTRALSVAQDTALREKRRALGRALAAGVMGDEARIDEELLFVRAVDDIDEMHIRMLGRFADGSRLTAGDVARADPGLGDGSARAARPTAIARTNRLKIASHARRRDDARTVLLHH